MNPNYHNIAKIARQTCGLTQERFAEMLDVSPEAVRQYEAMKIMPSDDVVVKMVELASMPVLGYWHILNKSRVAADLLPTVQHVPLAQAVVQLLCAVEEFKANCPQLLSLAADGQITDDERIAFEVIVDKLDGIIAGALAVKMAKEDKLEYT